MQKILIVEDDKLQRDQLYQSISMKYPSWNIICSKDYQSAKDEIDSSIEQNNYFTLFLLDIQLSSDSADSRWFFII